MLLIDDEEDFLEIASVKLQSEGFDTIITHSVSEALAKAEELQPDLVLSDIFMEPGPNGWDLALSLHQNQKTKNIKIAFFTSLRDPSAELSARAKDAFGELGNIHILSKTDDVPVLDRKVAQIIGCMTKK